LIKQPKKLLSSPYFLPAVFSIFSLGIFYLYALKHQGTFFFIIGLAQIVVIAILISSRNRLIKLRAETELKRQDYLEKSNLLENGIRQEKLAISSFQKKIVNYSQLKDLTEKLSLSLNLSDTSQTLSTEVDKLFGGQEITVILYLFQSKTGELGLLASQKGQMRVNLKSKKGDIFDDWVAKTTQPLLVEDTKNDYRFDPEKIILEDTRTIRSLVSVPLAIGNKVLGILRVDSPRENYFTVEELRFLTTIADLGAVAIENAQLYERLEELATKDGLTGLYLRRHLIERLGEEISRQLRQKKELSFLMIDLDYFKQYNDKLGHMAGDIVLKSVGMILLENFKDPGSFVSRYGGEEFAVLLPDCSKEEAVRLAEELRKRIKKQDIILRKQITHITVSIGVATFPHDAQVKDELIQCADRALYEAKNKGRDRVCFF